MPSLSCSFVTFSNKGCDISKRFPGVTEYFPLTSCHQDIKAHLRAVNVSQTSILTEKDLILARSGHFEEEGLNMTVCPKHRAELGIFLASWKKMHSSAPRGSQWEARKRSELTNVQRSNEKVESTYSSRSR